MTEFGFKLSGGKNAKTFRVVDSVLYCTEYEEVDYNVIDLSKIKDTLTIEYFDFMAFYIVRNVNNDIPEYTIVIYDDLSHEAACIYYTESDTKLAYRNLLYIANVLYYAECEVKDVANGFYAAKYYQLSGSESFVDNIRSSYRRLYDMLKDIPLEEIMEMVK